MYNVTNTWNRWQKAQKPFITKFIKPKLKSDRNHAYSYSKSRMNNIETIKEALN